MSDYVQKNLLFLLEDKSSSVKSSCSGFVFELRSSLLKMGLTDVVVSECWLSVEDDAEISESIVDDLWLFWQKHNISRSSQSFFTLTTIPCLERKSAWMNNCFRASSYCCYKNVNNEKIYIERRTYSIHDVPSHVSIRRCSCCSWLFWIFQKPLLQCCIYPSCCKYRPSRNKVLDEPIWFQTWQVIDFKLGSHHTFLYGGTPDSPRLLFRDLT